jgi:hypothetical protein
MVKSEGMKDTGAGDVAAAQKGPIAKIVPPAPSAVAQEPQAGGSYQRCPESGALTRVVKDAAPEAN